MKTIYLILLTLCLQLPAKAQKYLVRQLGMEQALSNYNVTSIAQDKYGFVWVATEEGLNRLIGNRFQTFYHTSKNKNSLSSNELNCILDDPTDPIMWIGTKSEGLNAYNYKLLCLQTLAQ